MVGNLRYKIGWVSLYFKGKEKNMSLCRFLPCFILYLRVISKFKPGSLYSEGLNFEEIIHGKE